MPVIGPVVLVEVEKVVVMLTTFGFDASFVGVKERMRPEVELVKAVCDPGWAGAGAGALDAKKSFVGAGWAR